MNILVLGGSGNISSTFCAEAMARGHDVTAVTRGSNDLRRRPLSGVKTILGDLKDSGFVTALSNSIEHVDVVVNFLSYDAVDAHKFVRCFADKLSQYIFISTTAGYSKDPNSLPYTETTPFNALDWTYARNKREAELVYLKAYHDMDFPVTIARFGHTYDTLVPVAVGPADWTVPQRIRDKKPVVVHGDGSGIWSLLHSTDGAKALVGLCGNPYALGETVNVVSSGRITWTDLTKCLFKHLATDPQVCFVPSHEIHQECPYLGAGIVGHKMWNEFYNNSKLRRILPDWWQSIPIDEGIVKTLSWYNAGPHRKLVNTQLDDTLTELCKSRTVHRL